MADGDPQPFDPTGGGFTLPDAPGDFSETTPDQQTAQPGKRPHPFAPLTPAQEADERARLNFESSRRKTMLGSAQAADAARLAGLQHPEGPTSADLTANMQQEIQTGLQGTGLEMAPYIEPDNTAKFDANQESAKDTLAKMQADQLAYENMPAYKGLAEGLYSLGGQTAGMFSSPEAFAFPNVKFASAAWRAAHPLVADILGYGIGQAAIQGGANIVTQTNEIKANLRKEFDPVEASLAFPIGGAFGGGFVLAQKGGAALYRWTSDAIERWAQDAVMRAPTLTPEIKPPIPATPPQAPSDIFQPGIAQQVPGASPLARMGEPPPGTVRLFRAAGPGDDTAQHVLFSPTQFPGANEFIDVPANVAAARAHGGDRVSLPADYAGVRQKIPDEMVTTPQGAPLVVTNAMKEELGTRGYPPEQIKTMTPQAAADVLAKPAPAAEGKSVFENLPDYNAAVRGNTKEPQTFTQWVRSQGGLVNNEEIKSIYGRTKTDLVRKNGKSLDNIREAAVQQGRLDENATIEDVKNILRSEEKGGKHYHPADQAQAAKVKETADLKKTMADVDAAMRESNLHPTQVKGVADKGINKDIRNRAIEIAHTEEVDPVHAVDRAMREYDEHANAIDGAKFDGAAVADEIPFHSEPTRGDPFADTPAASREGRPAGAAEPGQRPAGEGAPGGGGGAAPNATERGIATRLKGMAGQGLAASPGATRPGEGVASANHVGPLTPLEGIKDMMRRIAAQLELIVRQGVHEKGAIGQYDFKTGIARLSETGPDGVTTMMHEVGHDLENRMAVREAGTGKLLHDPVGNLIAENHQSMKAFAGVMGEGLGPKDLQSEGFAEFIAAYVTNRSRLELVDPIFTKKFVEMMQKENPELLRILDDANASFERYNKAPSTQAVDSMIVTHGEVPVQDKNNPLQMGPVGLWFAEKYYKYVNKQSPMTIAVRYLARAINEREGKLLDLRPDQDPRVLAQVLGDAGFQKTVMDLTYGIQSFRDLTPTGPAFLSIVRRVTADVLSGQEVTSAPEYLARLKSWDGYLSAKWHLELRRQMSNGEIDLVRMPTAMTDGDAMVKVSEAEKLHTNWPALAEEVYAWNKLQAKFELEAGLRSPESYAEIMLDRNHMYVPLFRDMRGISESLGVGTKNFRGSKPLEELGLFKRTGSGRDIRSPTETMMERMASINDAAHQNMIVRHLRDLVLRAGEAASAIAEMVPNAELRALDINVEQAVYKSAIAAGWLPDDAKALTRDLLKEVGPDLYTKLYRKEAISAGNQPIIFGWEAGERFAMRLPDGLFGKHLVEVMDSVGPLGMKKWAETGGLVVDALTASSATLRAGATGTPTYAVKNLLRDAFQQYLLVPEAGIGTVFGKNIVRGFASYLGGDDSYRLYTSMGGIRGGVGASGFSRSSQQVEFERQIRRFVDPALGIEKGKFNPAVLQQARVDMAETMGKSGVEPHKQIWLGNVKEFMSRMEISESAGRVGLFRAVYDANIEMGRDTRYAMFDAAQKARDFIDYGRMGSKMEMWSRLVPFLNANIQGMDKFYRTYIGTPSSPGIFVGKAVTVQQAEYQHALRVSLGVRASAVAAISAGIAYAWEDDPVYQRLTVQQRSQNWIFRVPFLPSGIYDMLGGGNVNVPDGMQGAWIFIPKPWEQGSIFNLAERAVEFSNSGDPQQIVNYLKSLRYSFSVPNPLELPLIRTVEGLGSNYDDFFQRPIVSDSMKGIAPHLQANEYTNKFYVMLAQGMNAVWRDQDARKFFKEWMPYVGAMIGAAWSPMEAQYMMQGMFGDWPRELGGIGGIGRSLVNGLSGKDFNFQLSDVPALRAFVKDRMAMGEPMNELYNQIGQNSGRLTVANKTFSQQVKNGDPASANQYFQTLDDAQRDYVRIHQVQAGPIANVLSPLDRTSALASVTRSLKNGLLAEGGLATLRDPNSRIKLEDGKRDVMIRALNEYTVTEARNGLIVQGASGFKNQTIVDSKPYLDVINAISPEVGKELSAQLARSKVMPIETIQTYWPRAQQALRVGDGINPNQLTSQLKAIANQAASHGYEGGGRRAGRGAVDAGGLTVKKGKAAPVSLPAEAQ